MGPKAPLPGVRMILILKKGEGVPALEVRCRPCTDTAGHVMTLPSITISPKRNIQDAGLC
jgi:hypothetical protein